MQKAGTNQEKNFKKANPSKIQDYERHTDEDDTSKHKDTPIMYRIIK